MMLNRGRTQFWGFFVLVRVYRLGGVLDTDEER
jgi:hypothetical protein